MTSRLTRCAAPLLAAVLALPALAQHPNAKPAAKPAAAKPARATPAKKAPPPPVEAPLPDAPPEQIAAAEQTYFGNYACEFDQTLTIAMNAKKPGYVDVDFKKQVFTMKPVLSSTGALRLEDVKGRTLMIQIANKSMLMDVKAGQRLVDECLHDRQRLARAAMAAQPPTSTLGIDPAKAAAVAAAQQQPAPAAAASVPADTAAPATPR